MLQVADPDTAAAVKLWSGKLQADGFAKNQWWAGSPPEPSPATAEVYGNLPVQSNVPAHLSTAWLRLPFGLSAQNQLMTTVSGLTGNGNELTAEFAAPSPQGLRVVATSYLNDKEDDVSWRDVSIAHGLNLPVGTVAFRLNATATRSWFSFAMPTVRRLVPVADFLPRDGRTLVDWQLAWLYPCEGQPPILNGIVGPSVVHGRVRVRPSRE